MTASATDYFRKASNGTARPVVTYLQNPKTNGSTTAVINVATGWNTTTGVDVQIYLKDTAGVKVPGSETDWIATLSGTTLSNMTLKAGTEPTAGYPSGALSVVICTPTAAWADSMAAGILIHANQDGTLKAGAVDNAAVVASGILTADRSTAGANIETWRSEDVFDHIASGCVWSGDAYGSTKAASCTSGVVYLSGKRLTVAAVVARSFTASKDVYCDLHDNGDGTAVWVYTDNTTNAASPALTAGNLRGAIIVVGASNIANVGSVNMGEETKVLPIASSTPYAVTDSLGNLICPRDPQRKILGYKKVTTGTTGVSSVTQVTGLSCPVIVPTLRKIRVKAFAKDMYSSTAAGYINWSIWDGTVGSGTQIAAGSFNATNTTGQTPCVAECVVTPTATSKTYNVGLSASAGTANIEAAATFPAYISVELV